MKLVINERLKGKRLYREVWKPVVLLDTGEDYTGLYEVSNMGRVRSLDRWSNSKNGSKQFKKGKILKNNIDKYGYSYVVLCKGKKKKHSTVHRLVAFAFVDGWFEDAQVDHINTIRTCNVWTNLRWVTSKENSNNPTTLQRYSKPVINLDTGIIYYGAYQAGLEIGIKGTHITACCKGRQKTAGGYRWEYYIEEEKEVS